MAGRVVLPSLMVPRLPDWPRRMAELVVDRLGMPFRWGAHDCALWAADAIAAQLGRDPAQPLRGAYATERQARRVLSSMGGLQGIATAVLGQPLRAALLARYGDVGLMRCGALAVCAGETWLAVAQSGLAHLPLTEVDMAWRVGHA